MAYIVQNSPDDLETLDYRFEGGAPSLTIDGMEYQGVRLKGSGLATCFMMSIRVPEGLMAAVPTRIIVKPIGSGLIPDFAPAAAFSATLASDRFTAILEKLEPNRHQLIRIAESLDRNGQSLEKDFYLINVLTRLSAVDVAQSDVEWRQGPGPNSYRVLVQKHTLGRPIKLVLRRNDIEGYHFWQGGMDGLMGAYFCSESLRDAVLEAGLTGFQFRKCEEA